MNSKLMKKCVLVSKLLYDERLLLNTLADMVKDPDCKRIFEEASRKCQQTEEMNAKKE